jgi:hypothetical protein
MDVLLQPYVKPFLLILIIGYGSLAAPAFPAVWHNFMNTIYARIIWLALIVWLTNHDPGVGIACALAFIMSLNVSSGKGLFERFEGPQSSIMPSCYNYTVFDLLESFKNDKSALLNAMMIARLPGDLKITDDNAPLIATYLVNKGFALKAPCGPPTGNNSTPGWI